MLNLGFYKHIGDINNLIDCLKKVLKAILEEEEKNEQNQKSIFFNKVEASEQYSLSVQCRKKICDILMTVTMIKSDLEMRLFLNKLRQEVITKEELKKLLNRSPQNHKMKRATIFALTEDE
jgi:hypothetical protein